MAPARRGRGTPHDDEEWPGACPACGSKTISHEDKMEYTGGGYADRWTEFHCDACGHDWHTGTTSGHA